jgi:hypothetical protein
MRALQRGARKPLGIPRGFDTYPIWFKLVKRSCGLVHALILNTFCPLQLSTAHDPLPYTHLDCCFTLAKLKKIAGRLLTLFFFAARKIPNFAIAVERLYLNVVGCIRAYISQKSGTYMYGN